MGNDSNYELLKSNYVIKDYSIFRYAILSFYPDSSDFKRVFKVRRCNNHDIQI